MSATTESLIELIIKKTNVDLSKYDSIFLIIPLEKIFLMRVASRYRNTNFYLRNLRLKLKVFWIHCK